MFKEEKKSFVLLFSFCMVIKLKTKQNKTKISRLEDRIKKEKD
jgi:hypothetical protein